MDKVQETTFTDYKFVNVSHPRHVFIGLKQYTWSEFLTVVKMSMFAFRVVTLFGFVGVCQRFEGVYCLRLQGCETSHNVFLAHLSRLSWFLIQSCTDPVDYPTSSSHARESQAAVCGLVFKIKKCTDNQTLNSHIKISRLWNPFSSLAYAC
jgi:hypothetical protein